MHSNLKFPIFCQPVLLGILLGALLSLSTCVLRWGERLHFHAHTKQHRLRVFENGVLRRIFGPKRDEDGSWRKLHNDEFHSLYSSQNIFRVIKSRRMRWAGHVARMGEGRGVYRVLVGRPEDKRPLGRPRRRWEDNIKMDLRKIGIDGANWIRLSQDRVRWRAFMNTVMNLRVP
jgi:hypothetical protein